MDEAKARGEVITVDEAYARAAAKIEVENKERREALARDEAMEKAAWRSINSPSVGTVLLMDSTSASSSGLAEHAQSPYTAPRSTLKRSLSVGNDRPLVKNGAILPHLLSEKAAATSTCNDDSNKPVVSELRDYPLLRSKGPLKRSLHENDAYLFSKRSKLSIAG